MDKILNLLGLMRKANALDVGEANTSDSVRGGKSRLVLLAQDASDNARHRAECFVNGRNTELISMPYTKEQLAGALGTSSCSMVSVTDMGFANALMSLLANENEAEYGAPAEKVQQRFLKAQKRKSEKTVHKMNRKSGKGGLKHGDD